MYLIECVEEMSAYFLKLMNIVCNDTCSDIIHVCGVILVGIVRTMIHALMYEICYNEINVHMLNMWRNLNINQLHIMSVHTKDIYKRYIIQDEKIFKNIVTVAL